MPTTNLPGTNLASPAVPFADDGRAATLARYSDYHKQVASLAERNALKVNPDRKLNLNGMGSGVRGLNMIATLPDGTEYRLEVPGWDALTASQKVTALENNANWQPYVRGGGGTSYDDTALRGRVTTLEKPFSIIQEGGTREGFTTLEDALEAFDAAALVCNTPFYTASRSASMSGAGPIQGNGVALIIPAGVTISVEGGITDLHLATTNNVDGTFEIRNGSWFTNKDGGFTGTVRLLNSVVMDGPQLSAATITGPATGTATLTVYGATTLPTLPSSIILIDRRPGTGPGGTATPLSNATPAANGTAAAGTSAEASRADHVHPIDTTRAAASSVGTLTSLTTTDKSNLVAAINEVNAKPAGSGDMAKATYDTDNSGIVDNAERLGGQLPAYYDKAETYDTATYAASYAVDFSTASTRLLNATGNLTFTTSANKAQGQRKRLVITNTSAGDITVTLNTSWLRNVNAVTVSTGKSLIVSLECLDSTEAKIIAGAVPFV